MLFVATVYLHCGLYMCQCNAVLSCFVMLENNSVLGWMLCLWSDLAEDGIPVHRM